LFNTAWNHDVSFAGPITTQQTLQLGRRFLNASGRSKHDSFRSPLAEGKEVVMGAVDIKSGERVYHQKVVNPQIGGQIHVMISSYPGRNTTPGSRHW
jgi:hypothetical protein